MTATLISYALIILLMYCIKQCLQGGRDVCIDSIRRKFQPIPYLKPLSTPGNYARLFFSPTIDKIIKKYQSIPSPKEGETLSSPQFKASGHCKQGHKKRWSEIEKEEQDAIRNQINQIKADSQSSKNSSKIQHMSHSPGKKRSNHSISQKSEALKELLRQKAKYGGSWIDHIRSINSQKINKRQSIIKSNHGFLFPEVFVKLPKIDTHQQNQQSIELAKSPQINHSEHDDIFCSRKIKRSQLKFRAQKIGDHAYKRKKFDTINHLSIIQPPIQPWSHHHTFNRPLFLD